MCSLRKHLSAAVKPFPALSLSIYINNLICSILTALKKSCYNTLLDRGIEIQEDKKVKHSIATMYRTSVLSYLGCGSLLGP